MRQSRDIGYKSQDVLDARKENLRRAIYQQNGWNQPKQVTARGKSPSSQYKGVSYSPYKGRDRWVVLIKHVKEGEKKETGKVLRCGYFWDEIEAAKAYNKKIVELRGERSWVNPIPQEIQHKHPVRVCRECGEPIINNPVCKGKSTQNPDHTK